MRNFVLLKKNILVSYLLGPLNIGSTLTAAQSPLSPPPIPFLNDCCCCCPQNKVRLLSCILSNNSVLSESSKTKLDSEYESGASFCMESTSQAHSSQISFGAVVGRTESREFILIEIILRRNTPTIAIIYFIKKTTIGVMCTLTQNGRRNLK